MIKIELLAYAIITLLMTLGSFVPQLAWTPPVMLFFGWYVSVRLTYIIAVAAIKKDRQ
jgi:hypothetical protein